MRFPDLGKANPAVKITPSHRCMPRAIMYRKLPFGAAPGFAPLCVDANDPETQVAGLKKRLARELPVPNKARLCELAACVDEYLQTIQPLSNIMTVEEWLGTTMYNQKRKDDLLATAERLHGCPPSMRQRSKIASFVKRECYPEMKHARWINSRSDYFKVYSGPAFKEIEHVIYSDPHFIKHVPVPLRPARIAGMKLANARYFGTDYTSFEASFTPEVMEALELRLYRHMLQKFPELSSVICSTISGTNLGSTRAGVKFKCVGQRMSGDMCTSLGNGFSNYMVMRYLMKKCGHTNWDCVVEGDDGLCAVYDAGRLPTFEDYAELGFNIKIQPVNDPELASFCGVKYVDGVILRDPRDFLASFGWTSSFMTAGDKIMLQLLRAKALSAIYENSSCPLVGVIARRALTLTQGVAPRFVFDGYHTGCPRDEKDLPEFCPSPRVRDVFNQLYGVPADLQIALEHKIALGDDDALKNVAAHLLPTAENLFMTQAFTQLGG